MTRNLIQLFFAGQLLAVPLVEAVVLPPVPTEPIYFEPPAMVEKTEKMQQISCVDLDNGIRLLSPYMYSYKAGFYEDDANKLATSFVMLDAVPVVKGLFGFAYLGYSALVEEKEQRRTLQVKQHISMLQQLKAEKHCFE